MTEKQEGESVVVTQDEETLEPETGEHELSLDHEQPEGEAWHDDLQPEDDFHDHGEGMEEEVDDTPEELPEPSYDEGNQEAKKRGKNILFGAMAVGAVFLGGLVYLQFGSSGDTGPVAAPVASLMDVKNIKSGAAPSQMQPSTRTTDAAVGPMDVAGVFKNAGAQSAALPSGPTDTGGMVSEMMTSDVDAPPQPQGASQLPPPPIKAPVAQTPPLPMKAQAPVKAEELPAAKPIPAPALQPEQLTTMVKDAAPLPPPAMAAIPAPVAAAPAKQPEVDNRIKEMSAQIETLKAALDKSMQQSEQLMSRVEALQNAKPQQAAQDGAASAALEERMAKLEQQLVAQSQGVAKVEKTSQVHTPKPVEPQTAIALHDELSSAIAREMEPKSVVKKAEKVKKPSTPKATKAASSKSSGKWILRAATPDAAWVSKDDGSPELRRVAVGESLPGIGKVKEIRQEGDTWKLVGTSGSVR